MSQAEQVKAAKKYWIHHEFGHEDNRARDYSRILKGWMDSRAHSWRDWDWNDWTDWLFGDMEENHQMVYWSARDSLWTYKVDSSFVAKYFWDDKLASAIPSYLSTKAQLCSACKDIINFDRSFSLSELQDQGNTCQLCKLLYSKLVSQQGDGDKTIRVERNESYLVLSEKRIKLCQLLSDPDSSIKKNEDKKNEDIQIGLPDLYAFGPSTDGASPYFKLLRHWLQDCDKHHDCAVSNHRKSSGKPLIKSTIAWLKNGQVAKSWPTRVIFVGHSTSENLKLENLTSLVDYVALSHCWGHPTVEQKKKYCTTDANYQDRLTDGFILNDLPKTFQDAVRVTRELGKLYLWIDSLCIIQENKHDWETESKRMEDVFALAYCTIAASSATNWDDGFLGPHPTHRPIAVEDVSGRKIYITGDISDFEYDIDRAPLNQRSWVLQERLLSRRIIHFTARYTYWQCGKRVRCDDFTRTECPPGTHNFLLDPKFPNRLQKAGYFRSIHFLQFLFRQYAQSGLTKTEDRIIAIHGLIERMGTTFDTEARYGTFALFLHRLLLWLPLDEKICKTAHETFPDIPSWSWMRYHGVGFLSISKLKVADVRFGTGPQGASALITEIREFQDCEIEQKHAKHEDHEHSDYFRVLDSNSEEVGCVSFDGEKNCFQYYCAVVGMDDDDEEDNNKTYYILIVRDTGSKKYERIGIGVIRSRYVCHRSHIGTLI